MISAGLLLAAGLSRRFGDTDKLLALLDGEPLIAHAAGAMRGSGLHPLIAVISNPVIAKQLSGFVIVFVSNEPSAQSRSLAAGIGEARRIGADRVTIALGDMPHITPDHLRLINEHCPPDGASATTDGTRKMPPAAFARAMFSALEATTGDRGAVSILRAIPDTYLIAPDAELLRDVDTSEDLEKARAHLAQQRD